MVLCIISVEEISFTLKPDCVSCRLSLFLVLDSPCVCIANLRHRGSSIIKAYVSSRVHIRAYIVLIVPRTFNMIKTKPFKRLPEQECNFENQTIP